MIDWITDNAVQFVIMGIIGAFIAGSSFRMIVLLHVASLAHEAALYVESKYPKGQSPGAAAKLKFATEAVLEALNKKGWALRLIVPISTVTEQQIEQRVDRANMQLSAARAQRAASAPINTTHDAIRASMLKRIEKGEL